MGLAAELYEWFDRKFIELNMAQMYKTAHETEETLQWQRLETD